MRNFTRTVLFVLLSTGCGDDSEPAADATMEAESTPCVDEPVTLAVSSPSSYACGVGFQAEVSVTNGSCASITIQAVEITATVTEGLCAAAAPAGYPPAVASVGRGKTAVVLDLTADPFCCLAPGCPATLECDETFAFSVATSVGVLSSSVDAHLSLGGCGEICQ